MAWLANAFEQAGRIHISSLIHQIVDNILDNTFCTVVGRIVHPRLLHSYLKLAGAAVPALTKTRVW